MGCDECHRPLPWVPVMGRPGDVGTESNDFVRGRRGAAAGTDAACVEGSGVSGIDRIRLRHGGRGFPDSSGRDRDAGDGSGVAWKERIRIGGDFAGTPAAVASSLHFGAVGSGVDPVPWHQSTRRKIFGETLSVSGSGGQSSFPDGETGAEMRFSRLLAFQQNRRVCTRCVRMNKEVGLEGPKPGRAAIAYSNSGR